MPADLTFANDSVLSTNAYAVLKRRLAATPKTWLVTGVAGFIGSHLLETLLNLGQRVLGIDDFSTGRRQNLHEVSNACGPSMWSNFHLINDSICDLAVCRRACRSVDFVLHQAARGSVLYSIQDPISVNENNVIGFLNLLVAAREGNIQRFVYASSSSTYGDDSPPVKLEGSRGSLLSPYAVTKYINELYADVFGRCYGIETVGLRYFNVFGPRQDPEAEYAAVIPTWIARMQKTQPVFINGTGDSSRDFVFVADIVQANMLAATTTQPNSCNQVYNVGTSKRTSLRELFTALKNIFLQLEGECDIVQPLYRPLVESEVQHSQADITKISRLLGYSPAHELREALLETVLWYRGFYSAERNTSRDLPVAGHGG